jgi:RimJ/RimL family protein N-acetyltransferase
MAMSAPRTVRTARLLLRPFVLSDVAAYAAIRAKPEVMRYLPGGEARTATARQDAERLTPLFASLWDEVGYGPWAALDCASGALLGHVGLRRLPELGGETEVLYMLDSAAWGRGLAKEGAAAARDYGFGVLSLSRLIGLVLPDNTASLRVLERIGMRREETVDAFGLRVVRCAVERPSAG